MPAHCVPEELIEQGKSPHWSGDPPTCRVCKATYAQHSGRICRICREAVEHHDDQERMDLEIAGAVDMASARLAAGLDIRPWERWVLTP